MRADGPCIRHLSVRASEGETRRNDFIRRVTHLPSTAPTADEYCIRIRAPRGFLFLTAISNLSSLHVRQIQVWRQRFQLREKRHKRPIRVRFVCPEVSIKGFQWCPPEPCFRQGIRQWSFLVDVGGWKMRVTFHGALERLIYGLLQGIVSGKWSLSKCLMTGLRWAACVNRIMILHPHQFHNPVVIWHVRLPCHKRERLEASVLRFPLKDERIFWRCCSALYSETDIVNITPNLMQAARPRQ